MGLFRGRIGALILMLAVVAGANKVLYVYHPWAQIPSLAVSAPEIFGINVPNNRLATTAVGGNWWKADFGDEAPSQAFSILNEGTYSKGGSWHEYMSGGYDTNLTGVGSRFMPDFADHDTIWMTPDSLDGGPPRFRYSKPTQIVVMFWNPWEASALGRPPSIQADSLLSNSMDSVPGRAGWYSSAIVGFSHLDIQFHSSSGSQSLGANGIVSSKTTTPIRFDSLADRDTIWVYQSPVSGAAMGMSSAPRGRVVDFFNPWDGAYPMVLPRAVFSDGAQLSGIPVIERCGWFRVVRYDATPSSVQFTGSGKSWGVGGSGSTTGFPIGSLLLSSDTVRIGPDSLGAWQTGIGWTSASGQCYLSRLAGTIRDFDSKHPAFEHYYNCWATGMVRPILGSDGTPIWDTAKGKKCGVETIYDWFHDNPSKEYTSCSDIPLSLNQPTGIYSYENWHYFPIDSIPTSVDKFNDPSVADDGNPHNFHFCLETHAVFDYHPGQKFDFTGDDDVWVYINRKLVVDLGGVHDAAQGSVALDTIGLEPGKSYPFDFFFCERRTVSSHMKISTSLNLRNIPDYEIKESHPGPGKGVYDLWSHNSRGQGCGAIKYDKPEEGLFVLSGPSFATGIALSVGNNYGGIEIRSDSAEIRIDSSLVNGLLPGTYTIHISFVGDPTKGKDVQFVVPVTGIPRFYDHSGILRTVGATVRTEVWAEVHGSPSPVEQAFRLRQVPGITWCADSLCQRVVGANDTLMTGRNGVHRPVWVRGDSVGAFSLVLLAFTGDSTDVLAATFKGGAPDSAFWTDLDGDGRADHATIYLHQHWTSTTSLKVAWPDNSIWVGPEFPSLVVSADSMRVDITIAGGLAGTVAKTLDLGRWSQGGLDWQPFDIQDRVPPVPLRAILHRGTSGTDTLRVMPSEPIRPFGDLDDVLRKRAKDGTLPSYAFTHEWLDTTSGELVLVFPSTGSPVPIPGDSVRFPPGGKTMDLLRNVPGARSKAVQILGTDPAPYDAVMLDSDNDGRADMVVLRFRQPLAYAEGWLFQWPNDSGDALDSRVAATSDAVVDSGGRRLTFRVQPFDFGATSCPSAGCGNLGALVSTDGTDSAVTKFAIRDGVAPVAILGNMRYSGQDGVFDTLSVRFSEPVVVGSDPSRWIAYGDSVPGSSGTRLGSYRVELDSTGTRAIFYVDTFVVPKSGDAIRINRGSLRDSAGNAPGDTAGWGRLILGPIPPKIGLSVYGSIHRWDGTMPPESEKPIQILAHGGHEVTGSWTDIGGSSTPIDTGRLVGGLLRLNGATEVSVYIYDLGGVFVSSRHITDLDKALAAAGIVPDARGNFQIWLAWDGKSDEGKMSGSGIYLMRVLAWKFVDNRKYAVQKILHLGWMVSKRKP